MPNTVPAAAEGLPKINRRSFLGNSAAAIPAMGMAAIVPASALAIEAPTTVERALERVNRIAGELSIAMEAWMRDLEGDNPTQYAHWIAHIHPAHIAEYPVRFENSRATKPVPTQRERVDRAKHELIDATKALYPEITDWRTLRDEDVSSSTVGLFMILGHRADEKAVL